MQIKVSKRYFPPHTLTKNKNFQWHSCEEACMHHLRLIGTSFIECSWQLPKLRTHTSFNSISSILGIYSTGKNVGNDITYKVVQCSIACNKQNLKNQPRCPIIEVK